MQVVFQKASLTAASCQAVHRVVIYPKAEGGRGTIHVYDQAGKVMQIILLDTIDAAVFTDDSILSPELLVLMPEPIAKKEEAHE